MARRDKDQDEDLNQVEVESGSEYLELSDEEFMKLPADASGSGSAQEEVEEPVAEDAAEDADQDDEEGQGSEAEAESDEDKAPEEPAKGDEGDESEVKDEAEKDADKADEKADEKDAEKDDDKDKDQDVIDYKAAYEKLTAPFKAIGKEFSVKNVDEAIQLMQMGIGFNRKMAALKPNLTLLKLLENNGLLSEEKISYLIDLEKKNPAAINKLVKDSGIDPMDLDAEKAGDYKPQIQSVDPREVELDAVLDEIQDSPTYNRTLQVVSKEWDAASKQVIADSPQVLKVINSHVESGIYDLISSEIERERTFGRLQGMSDIQAYKEVGDRLHAQGAFDRLGRQGQQAAPAAPQVVEPPKPKAKEDEAKLKEKRRAASPTKPAAASSSAPKEDFNPLALSDEEFSKMLNKKFL